MNCINANVLLVIFATLGELGNSIYSLFILLSNKVPEDVAEVCHRTLTVLNRITRKTQGLYSMERYSALQSLPHVMCISSLSQSWIRIMGMKWLTDMGEAETEKGYLKWLLRCFFLFTYCTGHSSFNIFPAPLLGHMPDAGDPG